MFSSRESIKKDKIFVIHESGKQSYSGLEQYGEPIILTKGFVNFKQEDLQNVKDRMREEIKKGGELDLILLSGPPFLVALFTQLWFEKFYSMRTLNWTGNGYTLLVLEDSNV